MPNDLDGVMLAVFEISVRSIDESKRRASFTAATENGVMNYKGLEYLRIDGMDLSRYAKNPVVLDSHDRYSIESILGRADMRKEGRQLIADVTFADSPKGNLAWGLTKGGMLNAGSVGFVPDVKSIRELTDTQTDGEGEYAIKGPGRVMNKSTLFEFSLCPVPADENALRRSLSLRMSRGSESDNRQRAICQLAGADKNLVAIAQRCILEGMGIEDARREMEASDQSIDEWIVWMITHRSMAVQRTERLEARASAELNTAILRTLTSNRFAKASASSPGISSSDKILLRALNRN